MKSNYLYLISALSSIIGSINMIAQVLDPSEITTVSILAPILTVCAGIVFCISGKMSDFDDIMTDLRIQMSKSTDTTVELLTLCKNLKVFGYEEKTGGLADKPDGKGAPSSSASCSR